MHIIGAGKEITEDYNEIHFHEDDDVRIAKVEMWMARNIGTNLVAEYPNRQWGVDVDIRGGMIVITCPSLSTAKGYHLEIKSDNIESLQRRSVEAAGEIMERYGLARGKIFDPNSFNDLTRLSNDEVVSADSDGVDPMKR